MQQTNARRGLWFFSIYLVLYLGFVGVNAFAPQWMERTPVAGLNVAILYGFGLIVAALLMAILYGAVCQDDAAASDREDES